MTLKVFNKSGIIDIMIVFSVFLIYFLWALCLPIQQAPDEGMRFLVPKYILVNGCLPNGEEPQIRDRLWGFSYAFTPYASSLFSVCFMRIASFFSQSEAVLHIASRMTSVFSGTGTVIFCLKTGKLVFERRADRWMFAIFVGFLPQFAFLSSYLNNDSFAVLTSAAIFYYWLKGIRGCWDVKSCIGLGIWIGFCALSYYNAYGYILCSMVIFCFSVFHRENAKKDNWKFFVKRGFLIFIIAFVIAGWFFIRNFILYHGDFLGMDSMYACGERHGMEEFKLSNRLTFKNQSRSVMDMLLHTTWLFKTICSFFAVFGYADIYVSKILYIIYIGIAVSGVCMGAKAVYSAKEYMHHKLILANGLLAMAIPIILSLRYSYAYDYQAQGRYIMPGLPVIMFFLTIGFRRAETYFSRKYFNIHGITAMLWLILFAGIFVKYIIPLCMGNGYPLWL